MRHYMAKCGAKMLCQCGVIVVSMWWSMGCPVEDTTLAKQAPRGTPMPRDASFAFLRNRAKTPSSSVRLLSFVEKAEHAACVLSRRALFWHHRGPTPTKKSQIGLSVEVETRPKICFVQKNLERTYVRLPNPESSCRPQFR